MHTAKNSNAAESNTGGGASDVAIPEAAAAQPAWFQPPRQRLVRWEVAAVFDTALEGHIVAGSLVADGMPAVAITSAPSAELRVFSAVLVPRAQLRRAQWLLGWPAVSDSELVYLATGEGSILGGSNGPL